MTVHWAFLEWLEKEFFVQIHMYKTFRQSHQSRATRLQTAEGNVD
jgi:hypothetical protein